MIKNKNIYLVAQYVQMPKQGVNTSKKGWMENPDNLRWDERVIISRGVKKRDQHAQVLLDLSEKRVERNSFTDRPFDELFDYFFANYSQYITQVMTQLDPSYMNQVVSRLEQAITESEQVAVAKIKSESVKHEETQAE